MKDPIIRPAYGSEISDACAMMEYYPSVESRGITNGFATAVYDHWAPNSVNVHICGEPLKYRNFVYAMFEYPFLEQKKGLLLAITPEDNKLSLDFSRILGFKEVHRIEDGWKPGVALIMKEMRKEHCRWLMRSAA